MAQSIVLVDNLPVKRHSKINYYSDRYNGRGNQQYLQLYNPQECSDYSTKNQKLINYISNKKTQQENRLRQKQQQTIEEAIEGQQNILKHKQISSGQGFEESKNHVLKNKQLQQKIITLENQVLSLKSQNKKLVVMNKTIQQSLFQKLFDSKHRGSVNNNSLIVDVFSQLISSHLTSESNPINQLTRQLLKQKQTTQQLRSTIQQNQSDITILNQILKQLASKLQQLTNQVEFHKKQSSTKCVIIERVKHLQNTNKYLVSQSNKLKQQIFQLFDKNNQLQKRNYQLYQQISIRNQTSSYSSQIFQLIKQLIQKDIRISNLLRQLENRTAFTQDTDKLIMSNDKNELIIEGLTKQLFEVRLKALNQKINKVF